MGYMYTGKLVFSQLMNHLPMHSFRRCVRRYRGEHWIKSFSCLDQYLCMAFARLTYRERLRDIAAFNDILRCGWPTIRSSASPRCPSGPIVEPQRHRDTERKTQVRFKRCFAPEIARFRAPLCVSMSLWFCFPFAAPAAARGEQPAAAWPRATPKPARPLCSRPTTSPCHPRPSACGTTAR